MGRARKLVREWLGNTKEEERTVQYYARKAKREGVITHCALRIKGRLVFVPLHVLTKDEQAILQWFIQRTKDKGELPLVAYMRRDKPMPWPYLFPHKGWMASLMPEDSNCYKIDDRRMTLASLLGKSNGRLRVTCKMSSCTVKEWVVVDEHDKVVYKPGIFDTPYKGNVVTTCYQFVENNS